MKKIQKNKKKVNSYRDAKDATSAHEKILADPTLPGTIGNFRSKRIFFRDALHLAHPARSSTFFSEKKSEKRHFAMLQPGAKFIRDEISVLSIYEFQKKKVNTFIGAGMENPAKLIPSQY